MQIIQTLKAKDFSVAIFEDKSYQITELESNNKTSIYKENLDLVLDIASDDVEIFNNFCERMINSEYKNGKRN